MVLFCLLLPFTIESSAAQFVEITSEIETIVWPSKEKTGETSENLNSRTWTIRSVVGTNSWLIEGDFIANGRETWWFTGTNMIRKFVITKPPSKDMELYERNHGRTDFPVGRRSTETIESIDGNPGRPPRTVDLLTVSGARICWLAFCSGPCLKRAGRQIFPPSDSWKEQIAFPSGFQDKPIVFEDDLGLPSSVNLHTTNNQPVLQYRVSRSTNVLGWSFPLEFHLAQYRPVNNSGWELELTAKGRATAIGVGTRPRIATGIEVE
ncbi:MAG: hypothetical protein EXS31_15035 [Pedosphaera sp.]|nr:hypothetical protein [Pedosphaera sp.]